MVGHDVQPLFCCGMSLGLYGEKKGGCHDKMNTTMTSLADRIGNQKPSEGKDDKEGPKPIVCPVMIDFLKSRNTHEGYGLFEGIPEAVEYSGQMTRNEMNRLKQGKIPAAFWDFLKKVKIISWKETIPVGGLTLGQLASSLQDPRRSYPSEGVRSMAHTLARIMLKADNPDLTDKSFAVGVWRGWEQKWLYQTAKCRE